MKKIADFIVDKRIPIMIAVLIVTIVCGVLIPMVEVNTDMTKYLPDNSAMKQGMDIMNEEFPEIETDKSVRVMFKGLSEEEKGAMTDRLSKIENVSAVDYKADDEDYNKGEYTKYVLKTKYDYGSPEENTIEAALEADFSEHDMKYKNDSSSRPGLPKWVILTALGLIVLILLIMCGSWLEPFLFLLTIALAIVINLGTNIFMGSIAETTFSIAAILQLILSMDYSIILMNRYRQELKTNEGTDNKAAMKRAIAGAFTSISSSSLTTVVGLLALLFMSFKIGFDMGIVLAKGVFLSVVCVFLVLPGLILLFSKALEKTKKPSLHIPTGGLAKVMYNIRIPVAICFFLIFIGAFLLQQQTTISYSLTGEDVIAEVFPKKSTVVMVYDNKDDEKVTALSYELEKRDDVANAINLSNSLEKQYTAGEMFDAINDLADMMGGSMDPDFKVDESVFRMIYYKYAGGQPGKMSVSEFLSFVSDQVMTNETFKDRINPEMSDYADLMKKFADPKTLQKPMTAQELSEFFGMDKSDCEQMFLYYFISEGNIPTGTMTVSEFVDLILNDLANDENYSDMMDKDVIEKIKTLKLFTDKASLEKKRSAKEIGELLGIDEDKVKLLFMYIKANDSTYTPDPMTIQELVSFLKNDIAADKNFSSFFDAATLGKVDQLAAYTDKAAIQQPKDAAGLAAMLGMDESLVRLMLRLDERGTDLSSKTMTLQQFVSFVSSYILSDPTLSQSFDSSAAAQLKSMTTIINTAASGKKLSPAELSQIMQMDEKMITQLFAGYSAQAGVQINSMTLTDFVNFLVQNVLPNPQYAPYFDDASKAKLTTLQGICNAASSDAGINISQFAQMFGMEEDKVHLIFALYYGDDSRTVSLYDFICYLCDNIISDPLFSSKLDQASASQLTMLRSIMDLALSDKQLSYSDAVSMFGTDEQTMKMIYTLKASKTADWKFSLKILSDLFPMTAQHYPL